MFSLAFSVRIRVCVGGWRDGFVGVSVRCAVYVCIVVRVLVWGYVCMPIHTHETVWMPFFL